MNIRAIADSETAAYDALARRHGSLFNCCDWLSMFDDRVQMLGLFEDGGQMVGGASLYRQRWFGLTVCRNTPFSPTCGPFLEVKARSPVAILETFRKAMECLAEYLDQHRYDIIRLAMSQQLADALPFFWHGYKVIPNYTYLVDLTLSWEQILKNMSSIRRNDISKASRDGLMVRPTTEMSVVRGLVLATFERQRKSIDLGCLDAILFRYAKSTNSFAFTTYRDDKPISTCFVVHDSRTAYYLLGGYDAKDRHHGAGPLAVAESIKYAQALGLKSFDFEGSMIPAIESYFRAFGGRLSSYLTVNKAWLPVEIVLKCIKRNAF